MNCCPLCQNATNVVLVRRQGGYDVLYCSDCRLQFSNPMDSPDAAFYQQCSLYQVRSKGVRLVVPSDDWRYQACLEFCAPKPNQSLLDIGCGDGGFLVLAQGKGFDVFGIDIDDRAIRLARDVRNLEHVKSGSWERLQSVEGWRDFDAVTLFDVLEHVSSPVSLIATVSGLLKPGGLVCITVPRLDRYPRVFDVETDSPPHHFTLWTANALDVLLRKTGFGEIRIIPKPLMAQDLFGHAFWRAKRLARSVRKKGIGSRREDSSSAGSRSTSAERRVVSELTRRVASSALMGGLALVSWFLRESHLGRGHTLLAVAKKL